MGYRGTDAFHTTAGEFDEIKCKACGIVCKGEAWHNHCVQLSVEKGNNSSKFLRFIYEVEIWATKHFLRNTKAASMKMRRQKWDVAIE
jgi:hypothetical protein